MQTLMPTPPSEEQYESMQNLAEMLKNSPTPNKKGLPAKPLPPRKDEFKNPSLDVPAHLVGQRTISLGQQQSPIPVDQAPSTTYHFNPFDQKAPMMHSTLSTNEINSLGFTSPMELLDEPDMFIDDEITYRNTMYNSQIEVSPEDRRKKPKKVSGKSVTFNTHVQEIERPYTDDEFESEDDMDAAPLDATDFPIGQRLSSLNFSTSTDLPPLFQNLAVSENRGLGIATEPPVSEASLPSNVAKRLSLAAETQMKRMSVANAANAAPSAQTAKPKRRVRHVQIQTRLPPTFSIDIQTDSHNPTHDTILRSETYTSLENRYQEMQSESQARVHNMEAQVTQLQDTIAKLEISQSTFEMQIESLKEALETSEAQKREMNEKYEEDKKRFDTLSVKAYQKIKALLMDRQVLETEMTCLREQVGPCLTVLLQSNIVLGFVNGRSFANGRG